MNYFEFYPGDYQRDTGHLSLAEHGAFLLLLAAYYGAEKPLPAQNEAIFRITKALNSAEKKAALSVANQFFPVREDGLRHNARADAEIAKAGDRMEGAKEKRGNENDRQKRTRARRTKLFMDLREVGVVPEALVTMAELKALHASHVTRDMRVTEDVLSRVTDAEDVTLVTGVNTATRPQTPDPSNTPERSCTPDGSLSEPAPAAVGTPAGRAAAALSRTGLRITSQNPNLIAACAEGVTVDALLEVRAMYPDKPAGYVIQAARSIHAERATATPRAGPTQPHTTGPTSKVGNAIAVLESMKSHGNHPEQHEPDGLDLRRDPAGPAATFLPGPRSAARR